MNQKQKRTLQLIFDKPTRSNVVWKDIESLLMALGAEISEGRGSRVRAVLNEVRAVFHRPHPQKEADRGTVQSVRRYLEAAGVKP